MKENEGKVTQSSVKLFGKLSCLYGMAAGFFLGMVVMESLTMIGFWSLESPNPSIRGILGIISVVALLAMFWILYNDASNGRWNVEERKLLRKPGEQRDIEVNFARNHVMRDLEEKVLKGEVRCTARNLVKGYPGETFHMRGNFSPVELMVVSLWYWPLGRVRDLLYPIMGFESPEQFQEYWTHIKHEFNEERHVYVHFFDFAETEGFGYWPMVEDEDNEQNGDHHE